MRRLRWLRPIDRRFVKSVVIVTILFVAIIYIVGALLLVFAPEGGR